ncbi:hypothetical protein RIF29_17649 [Crotalaria pallida]|uniref:TIR domain-containing protein n=1 Tax=Crotalaria pallida TaxID=3830 RepID=A0AAN9FHP2_CROPI
MLRGESSSNSLNTTSSSPWTHHVFLSFRQEDIDLDFKNRLYASLQQKEIIIFQENQQQLEERGDVISREFLKAIKESFASIVVLSENYASSNWCLDELQNIIESRRVMGREVLPIFYGVSPSDVRYKINKFGQVFQKHATRFEQQKEKVQKWRDSLNEVAGFSGWEYKNWEKGKLIEDIVESVWRRLNLKMPMYYNHDGVLIGIDSRVNKMSSLIRIELDVVRFIGLWGTSGIGKTTLAKVVYEKFRDQFEISCFIDKVSVISGETNGMLRLQRKILSHQRVRGLEIESLDRGKDTIRNLLFNKKVLLVLDDVDDIRQLESLAENKDWFGPGSRVIITTRDMQLLTSHGIAETYEIDLLNQDESLQLMCQKGLFKRDQTREHLSNVVQYGGGLPLAFHVLDIKKDDDQENNNNNNTMMKTLRATEFIQGIVLKSSTEPYEAIWHPEVFSKMCNLKFLIIDFHDMQLTNDLKCLSSSLKVIHWTKYPMKSLSLGEQLDELVDLRMHHSKIVRIWDENQFFANLEYIDLCNSEDLIETPIVSGAPCLQSMLLDSCTNLVKVHQSVGKHKKLVLLSMRNCINLQTFPRKLEMESLEKLILSGCSKVKKLPEFGTNMKCLLELSLENCKNLVRLPRSISNLKSLRRLNISGCSRFSRLPNMRENESLEELYASGTAIREISSSQVRLENLKEFSFGGKIIYTSIQT